MKSFSRLAALIGLGLGVLVVDFFTKAYALNLLPYSSTTPLYPYGGVGVFHQFLGIDFCLQLTLNRGAAWGLFQGLQIPLTAARLLILGALVVYLVFFNRQKRAEWGLVLICVGALGNLLDFFLYGFVVDFLHFTFWGYHFPVFNLADSAITVGAALLLIQSFFCKKVTSHAS